MTTVFVLWSAIAVAHAHSSQLFNAKFYHSIEASIVGYFDALRIHLFIIIIIRIEPAINSVSTLFVLFCFICRCATQLPVFVKFTSTKCRDKREQKEKKTTKILCDFSFTRMPFDREARFQNRNYLLVVYKCIDIFAIIFSFIHFN